MDKTCQELEIHLKKKSKDNYLAQAVDSKGKIRGEKSFVLEMDKLKMREDLQRLEKLALSSEQVKDHLHINFGKHMFNLVFGDGIKAHYDKCLTKDQPLRIRIRVDESVRELHNVPWEFLHDGEDFLVTQSETLISRLPLNVKRKKRGKLDQAVSMLVVISNPLNLPDHMVLNTEREQEVILGALDKLHRERKLDIDFVDDASLDTIQDYLSDKEYHILHFTGHGVFDENTDRGFLLLEDSNHLMRNVENEEVATILQNHKSLRLVVLSACQSAKASNNTGYPDLSRTLLQKGVPAVLSMQHSVLDTSATDFADRFYRSLAGGKAVDDALFDARMTLYAGENRNRVDFATPVLFLNDANAINLAHIKVEEKATGVKEKQFDAGEVAVMRQGFVGRRRELRAIREGFTSGRKRAYMIHGFGGIGKSVLATRAALNMQDHFDGAKVIKVGDKTTPEQIMDDLNGFLMVAGCHKFNKHVHDPISMENKTGVLVGVLNEERLLIILDNLEDVLTKDTNKKIANPSLNKFIQLLLNGVGQSTKFIFTSRYDFDPLDGRLPGHIGKINLPELSFPFMSFLMNNFEALGKLPPAKKLEIYQKTGGHPFALGVFDRHAQITSVDSVLSNLAPVKKEMIEFTLLGMTYNRLSPKAQTLLKRMSVFEEAVPLEALEWMMGDDDQPATEIDEELQALSGWGLVVKKEEYLSEEKAGLYAMHQLVTDFATDKLEDDKTQQTNALLVRAARFYEILGKSTKSLWDWLQAREYYYKAHEYVKAFDIVGALTEPLLRWGHMELLTRLLTESASTLERRHKAVALGNLATLCQEMGDYKTAIEKHNEVKDIFQKEGDRANVAVALHQLGMIHEDQGNYKEAVKNYEEGLKLSEELGDKAGIARSLHHLGNVYLLQGSNKEAAGKYKESLKIVKELGNKSGIAATLHQLGMIHQDQGNYKEAVKKYEEALKIRQELGEKSGIAYTLGQLGNVHYDQGNYAEAQKNYEKVLRFSVELGDTRSIAITLHQLGMIHQDQGNYKEAVKKYEESLKIKEELGGKSGIAGTLHQLGNLYFLQGDHKEAVKKYEESLKINEELGDKRGIAGTLHQLGTIDEAQGNYRKAMQYYLPALAMFQELGSPNAEIALSSLARLRKKMGENEFEKLWKELTGGGHKAVASRQSAVGRHKGKKERK
ncbi:MAG: tetratricopeptide repeat protein [Candidatus Zixiibacteriota bacterium]